MVLVTSLYPTLIVSLLFPLIAQLRQLFYPDMLLFSFWSLQGLFRGGQGEDYLRVCGGHGRGGG